MTNTNLSVDDIRVMALPPKPPRIAYGQLPEQFGELRLPDGPGPWPVMVLVHGGCWRNRHSLDYITHLAQRLTGHGWATWTLEYRRLGDIGGGWPGTLLDTGAGLDHLRTLAKTQALDLKRIVVAGHSAGGQLALWLAARPQMGSDSELYIPDPLPVSGVLGLAAITDLDSYRVGPPESCHAAVDLLMGGSPQNVPERYAKASPLRLLPLNVPQVFLQGECDDTVSLESVRHYVNRATDAGDQVSLQVMHGGGHFEVVMPSQALDSALLNELNWLRAL